MAEFTGKAAFVTGAGSGIGRASAQALAAQGAFVWVTDFDATSAEATADMIRASGGGAEALRLDVSQEAEWTAGFARADQRDEPLSVLVNCAGKSIYADTFSMSLEDFRSVMAVNSEGTFLGMKHGIPRIAQAGGGAVVNISSLAGLKGLPGMAAYCASKGAVRLMTKSVAIECARLGNKVRVNSVHPGVVDTPAWQKHGPDQIKRSRHAKPGATTLDPHDVAKSAVPLGVACSPEEVAGAVCYLTSDVARHITGAEIVIDGGMTAA